jgi:gluconate 2-dehydrogenase gamma chain
MLRRAFLTNTGTAFGSSWISLNMPAILATMGVACKAKEAGGAFRVMSPEEAIEFEAIATRIIPSGDSPGAKEAGVIYFIDTLLADVEPELYEPLQQGLQSLNAQIRKAYDTASFAGLDSSRQIEALQEIDYTPFFENMRFLTLAGMFCDPSYGGNRDEVGWKLIGMERPTASQPPFGYYDADYLEKGA